MFKGFSLGKNNNVSAKPKVNLSSSSSASLRVDEVDVDSSATEANHTGGSEAETTSKKRRWDIAKDVIPGDALRKKRLFATTPSETVKKEEAEEAEVNGEGEEDELDAYVQQLTSEINHQTSNNRNEIKMQPSDHKQRSSTPFRPGDDDNDDDDSRDSLDEEDRASLLASKLASVANSGSTKKDVPVIDHSSVDYEDFNKKFYVETPDIARLTDTEVQQLRLELDNIQVHGIDVPKPISKWSQAGLDMRILSVMSRQNYTAPTAIQAQAIPAIMSGRDVIGIAETGSGKTLAYVLPLLRHICDQRPIRMSEGPIALILTPTRELAEQVYTECRRFSDPLKLKAVRVYGGVPLSQDLAQIKPGCHILVATTGRLIDLLTTGRNLSFKRVTSLVLDEADRMFDMGFEPQVMKIVQNIRPDRQTVLFSATFPRQMEALARRILTHPVEIVVGGKSVVCSNVQQVVEVRDEDSKFYRLLEVLGLWMDLRAKGQDTLLPQRLSPSTAHHPLSLTETDTAGSSAPSSVIANRSKALIFVNTQDLASTLYTQLNYKGYACQMLHGGMDQMDREDVLRRYKKMDGDIVVLIATSVAARGLDVKYLTLVINFSCPNHAEDYVHRCGRTGRAGTVGSSVTFITEEEDKYAGDIIKALQDSKHEIPESLKLLQKVFNDKVKAGQATRHGSGFGGKGLDKIDKEREAMLKAQKQRYGVEDEKEEKEEEKEMAAASGEFDKPEEEKADSAVSSEVNSVLKAAQERAAVLNLNISVDTKVVVPVVKRNTSEVEINDLPQIVRFRLTHRDNLGRIEELTHAALTVRGEYIDKDKVMVAGKRKLYIYVEAEEKQHVDFAVSQIRKFIEEQVMSSSASALAYTGPSGSTSSKYTVV